MRRPRPLGVSLAQFTSVFALCGALAAGVGSAKAATLYWDGDGTAAGNLPSGAFLGGPGNWDTTSSFWWDGVSATANAPWSSSFADTAIFAGAAGLVKLAAPIRAGNLVFNTANYNLANQSLGTLTLGDSSVAGSGSIQVNAAGTVTIGAVIEGNNGLALSSTTTGTLALTGANTFTGDVRIASGTLNVVSDTSLGNAANGIVFNGTAGTLAIGAPMTFARGINTGSAAVGLSSVVNFADSGALTGSGTLTLSNNVTTTFSDAGGFSGAIVIPSGFLSVDALADPVGAGNIKFGQVGTNNAATLQTVAGGAASPLVLNNRHLELISVGGGATVNSLNANAANSITINSDLVLTTPGNKSLVLGGNNGGTNGFNGSITNADGFTTSLTKSNIGLWELGSASNTFTGTVTINQGTLRVTNGSLGGASSNFSLGNQGFVLELRNDGSIDYQKNLLSNGQATAAFATIYVDREVGGTGSNQMVTLGAISQVNSTASMLFLGDHGYSVTTGIVDARPANGAAAGTLAINNMLAAPGYVAPGYTAGTLTLGGITTGNVAGTTTQFLDGLGDYTPFSGNISSPFGAATPLNLTKRNVGLMTFSDDNSAWTAGMLTLSAGTTKIIATNPDAIGSANLLVSGGLLELRTDSDLDFTSHAYQPGNHTLAYAPLVGDSSTGKTLTLAGFTGGNGSIFFDTNHNYSVTMANGMTAVNSTNLTNVGNGLLTVTGLSGNFTYGFLGHGDTVLSGSTAATATVSKSGQGTLTLNGTNVFGNVSFGAGLIRVNGADAMGGTGVITAKGNGPTNVGFDFRLDSDADFSAHTFGQTYGTIFNADRASATGADHTVTLGGGFSLLDNNWSMAFTGAHGYSIRAGLMTVGNNVANGYSLFNFLGSGASLELYGGLAFNNVANASSLSLAGSGDYLISGPLSVNGTTTTTSTLNKNGTGVVTLAGDSSTSFNNTNAVLTVTNGITRVVNGNALGGANTKVNLNGGVLELRGDSAFATIPTLTIGGNSVLNVDRAVDGTGAGSATTLTSGPITLAAAVNLYTTGGENSGGNAYSLTTGTLTVNAAGSIINNIGHGGVLTIPTIAGTATVTFGGTGSTFISPNADVMKVSAAGITKNGLGSVTFSASTNFDNTTGALIVNAGTLRADYTNQSFRSVFSGNSTLTLAGGTFEMVGNATEESFENINNVTLNAGPGTISAVPQGTGVAHLMLGTLTATANGGTLLVKAPIQTVVSFAGGAIAPNGRAVFTNDGSTYDWLITARAEDGSEVAGGYAAYTPFATAVAADNAQIFDTATQAVAKNINTLLITTSQPGQGLTLSGTGVLGITTGGILFTGSDDYTISGLNGTAIGLKSSSGGNADLIVSNYGTGTLFIATPVLDSAGTDSFTKAGPGTVVLGNATTADINKYAGTTYVNGGILRMLNSTRLGQNNNQALVVNAGTFDVNGNSMNVGGFSGGVAGFVDNTADGAATLTIGNNNQGGIYNGTIRNTGGVLSITKVGTSGITLGDAVNGGSNLFTGDLTLSGTGAISLATLADAAGSHINYTVTNGAVTYIGNTNLVLNNRAITMTGDGITGILTSSGIVGANGLGGIVTINSDVVPNPSAANDTLTLAGTSGVGNTAWVNTIGGSIQDPSGDLGGRTIVNVTTTGAWQLTGNNTFTGGINMAGSGFLRLTKFENANGNTINLSNGTLEFRSDSSVAFNTPINWTSNNGQIVVDRAIDGAGYDQVMSLGAITQNVAGKNLYFKNALWSGFSMNGADLITDYGVYVPSLTLNTGATSFIINDLGTQGSTTFAAPARGTGLPGALTIDGINLTGNVADSHILTIQSDSNVGGVTILNGDFTQVDGTNRLGLTLGGGGQGFFLLENQTAATNFTGGLIITAAGNSAANTVVRATNQYSLGPSANPLKIRAGTLELRNDSSVNYGNDLTYEGAGVGNLYIGEAINGSGGHNNTFAFGAFSQNVAANTFVLNGVGGSANASGDSLSFTIASANFPATIAQMTTTNGAIFGPNIQNNLLLPGLLTIGTGSGTALTTTAASGTVFQEFSGAGYSTVIGDITDGNNGGKLGIVYQGSGSGFLTLEGGPNSNYSGGLMSLGGTVRLTTATSLGDPSGLIQFGNLTIGGGTLEVRSDTDVAYNNPISLFQNGTITVGQLPGGDGATGGQNKTVTLGPVTAQLNSLGVSQLNGTTISVRALTLNGIDGTLENNGYSVSIPSFTTGLLYNQLTNNLSLPGVFLLGGITSTGTSGVNLVTINGLGVTDITGPITDGAGGLTQIVYSNGNAGILNLDSAASNFSGGLIITAGTNLGAVRINNSTGAATFNGASQLGGPGNLVLLKNGILDFRTDVSVSYPNAINFDTTGDAVITADRRIGSNSGQTVFLGTLNSVGTAGRSLYVGGNNGYNLHFGGLVNANTAAINNNFIRNFGTGSVTFDYVRSDSGFAQTITFDAVQTYFNTAASNALTIIAGNITQNGAGVLSITNSNGTLDVTAVNRNLNGAMPFSGLFTVNSGTVIASDGVNFGSNFAIALGGNTTIKVRNDGDASFPQTFTTNGTATFDLASVNASATGHLATFGTIQPSSTAAQTFTFNGRDGYAATINNLRLPGTTGQTTNVVANIPVTINAVVNPESGFASSNFDTLVLDGIAGGTLNASLADAPTGSLTAGGTSRITKAGGGTWTLAVAQAYTGPTAVNGGTLRLGADNMFSDLSAITVTGSAAVGNSVLDYQAFSDSVAALSLNFGTILGSGKLTLTGNLTGAGQSILNPALQLTPDNTPGTRTITVNSTANDSLTLNGVVSDGVGNSDSITKTGGGILVLANSANSYTGGTIISAGEVAISDDAQLGLATAPLSFNGGSLRILGTSIHELPEARPVSITGAAGFDIADQSNTYALSTLFSSLTAPLNKLGPGTLTFATDVNANGKAITTTNGTLAVTTAITSTTAANILQIGNTALAPGNGGGAVVFSGGGSLTITGTDAPDSIALATATNSFGTLTLGPGTTVTGQRFRTMVGTSTISLLAGSTLTMSNYAISGNSSAAVGVLNVAGGTLNGLVGSGNGAWAGSRYEQNIGVDLGGGNRGGMIDFTQNPGVIFKIVDNNTAGFGVVNLIGGGILKVNAVGPVGAATGAGRSELNFHGGTLLYGSAAATQTNFISANVTAVNIFSEGGTIDSGTGTITVAEGLLAPLGAGVDSITASGSGYFTAPYVKITGGGGNNDATAVATIDANGNLTSIIVTNPGTGYTDVPTVTLVGGTNGVAGMATAALNDGNVGGGLIKEGNGTLILTGASTFTGPLIINGGNVIVSNGGSLNADSIAGSTAGHAIQVASGGSVTASSDDSLDSLSRALSTAGVGAISVTADMANSNVDLSSAGLNLPTFSLGAAGGTVNYNGNYTPGVAGVYRLGGGGNLLAYQPDLSGTNSVVLVNGPVTLTGHNTFTGGLTLAAGGTLRVDSANTTANFGNNQLGLVSTGGTIQWAAGSSTDVTSGAAAITGGLTFSSGTTILDTNGNDVTLSGALGSGAGAVSKSVGVGTLTLAGAENLAAPLTGNFTAATGTVKLANATALRNSTVIVGAANALTFAPGVGAYTVGNLSGSNSTGNFALADTDGNAITLRTGQNNANTNYSGLLSGPGNLTKIGVGIFTVNTNLQGYTGNTTLTGGVSNVNLSNGGQNNNTSTLQVTFPAGATVANVLPATTFTFGSASLDNQTPGGGTLSITGGAAAAVNTQSFANTVVAGGYSSTVLTNAASASANPITLNLGALTRTPVTVTGTGALASATGGGTINFAANTTGASALTTVTDSTNDANGLLGPWATVGLNDFATVVGGKIVAYTGYTNIGNGTTIVSAPGSNARLSAGATTATAADGATTDLNTLSIAATDTATTFVTIGKTTANTTGILRLGASTGTGTILMANGAGAVGIGNVANAGILTAGDGTAPGELLVNNSTTATTGNGVVINATIADGAGGGVVTLVKTGVGNMTLTGTNTYSGGTIVENGRVTLTTNQASVLGTGMVTIQPGGQVLLNATGLTLANNFSIAGTGINENNDFGAIRLEAGGTITGNVTLIGDSTINTNASAGSVGGTITGNITGNFSLGKTLGGGRVVLTGTNTYTGQTLASAGVLQFGNGTASQSSYAGLADHSVVTSGSGAAYVNTGTTGDFQAFLNTKASLASTGAFAIGTADAHSAIDFATPGLANAFLGSVGNVTYDGSFTPGNNVYRLGGGDNTLTFQPNITGTASLVIGVGNGTVVLTGTNTFRGGTTLANNTLLLDDLARLGNPAPGLFGLTMSGGTLKFGTGAVYDFTAITGGVSLASGTSSFDTNGATVNLSTPFSNVGTGTFQKNGSGTLNLGPVAPVYGWSGAVTANGGTLVLTSQDSINPNAGLNVNNSAGFVVRLGANITVGFVNMNVNSLPTFDLNGHVLTFGLNNAGSTLGGALANVDTATAGTGGITKIGFGAINVVPRAVSAYTGITQILGGSLSENFTDGNATTTANFFNPASSLVLGGGGLKVLGKNSAVTSSQTFSGTSLAIGESLLSLTSGGANPVFVTLGAIGLRSSGAVINFVNPSNTLSATNGINITTVNSSFPGGQQTILGGYATVNGNTWAVTGTSGNDIVTGLASYNSGFADGKDVDAASGASTPAMMTVNSLRFNAAGAANVDATAGLTVASGGILVTSSVGAANGVTFNNGTITSGNGTDLIIINNNGAAPAGAVTINSQITGGLNTDLTKAGTGYLVLGNAANDYGRTILTDGVLQIAAAGQLGALDITITNNASATESRLEFTSAGLIIPNAINDNNARPIGSLGTIYYNGAANGRVTLSGPISLTQNVASGSGHFGSAQATGGFIVTGPITAPYGVTVQDRNGFTSYAGGGTYYNFNKAQDTMVLGANDGLSTAAVVNLASTGTTTFDLSGFNQTVVGLTQTANNIATVTNSSTASVSTFTFNPGAGLTYTYGAQANAGTFSGQINLVKTGAGTQILSGANSFVGSVTVASGTLGVGNSLAFSTNNSLTMTGGTLDLNNTPNVSFGDFSGTGGTITDNGITPGASIISVASSNDATFSGTVTNGVFRTVTLSKDGTGTLTLASANHTGALAVNGGKLVFGVTSPSIGGLRLGAQGTAELPLSAGGDQANVLRTTSLSISGGAILNLTNNALIVDYPVGTPAAGSPLANIEAALTAGFNGGNWDGPGINSSVALTDSVGGASYLRAIGASEANVARLNSDGSFLGRSVDDTSVLVRYTLYGDANLDGVIDASDYSRIDNAYAGISPIDGVHWSNGDFNYDGVINGADYALIDTTYAFSNQLQAAPMASEHAAQFGESYTREVALLEAGGPGSIPEPGSFALLGAGGLLLGLRRRRNTRA